MLIQKKQVSFLHDQFFAVDIMCDLAGTHIHDLDVIMLMKREFYEAAVVSYRDQLPFLQESLTVYLKPILLHGSLPAWRRLFCVRLPGFPRQRVDIPFYTDVSVQICLLFRRDLPNFMHQPFIHSISLSSAYLPLS